MDYQQYLLNLCHQLEYSSPIYITVKPTDGRWKVGSIFIDRIGKWALDNKNFRTKNELMESLAKAAVSGIT